MPIIHPSSRHFLEYLTENNPGGAVRDTQTTIEAVTTPPTIGVLVTQETVETATTRTDLVMRVTQESVEAAEQGLNRAIRLTQESIEVLEVPIQAEGTTPIPLEWQTPSVLLNEGKLALCKRFYVDIDTGGESVGLTILVDNTDYAYPYPLATDDRETVEVDFQVSGRIYGFRLSGNLTFAAVEFFEGWAEIETGDEPGGNQASPA